MAAAAQARRATALPRREQTELEPARPAARRAPQARARAAQRARLTRAFVVFVVCLTVLAAGRVAVSFAVVQKTLQTDAVVREERRVSDENQQLSERAAQMGSTIRINRIAVDQLGLVDPAEHQTYLRISKGAHGIRVAEKN